MSAGHAPGPLLGAGAALCWIAFGADHPLIVGAVLAVSLMFVAATGERHRLLLSIALAIGLGVAVLNPFVQASGDLILFALPDIPIFDMQVTLEEVVAGLVIGARAAAVTLTIMAVLALVDQDRLLELAGRLLPRSALAASIAARLVPTLRRDAQSLVETGRLRGRSPLTGRWRDRASAAGSLALPLVGSSLDRAMDVAEAMAARGYGSGPRTRRPPHGWSPETRVILGAAGALCAVAVMQSVTGSGDYGFFPTLAPVWRADAAIIAAVVVSAGLVVTRAMRS